MATFDLYLDLSSVYTSTAPTFEVLVDGVVVSSFSVSNTFTPITLSSLVYSGDAPGYLSFRFNDADGEVDRSIALNEVRINGTTVNGSSLDKLTVLQGQESQLNVGAEQASFGIPGPGAGTDAVINGTAGVDNLNGTAGNDTINGLGDRDWIKGNGGIDTVNGGTGHDIIKGGDGNDILNGDDGQDLIKGDNDDDTLNGGAGHDTLYGGLGVDALNGDDGNDVLHGDAGIDTLRGGNDNDKIFGGDDGDFIYGDAGNDKAFGDGGNDSLYGGTGNDTLFGGAGNDIVDGEDDHDRLYGDAGQDTLYGRDGNDKLYGGADNDTLFGGNGNDKLFGEDGDDIINGEDGNDRIVGGAGIDTINGGDGIDNIDGNDGNDNISGGLMGDLIKGGAGDDTINGDDGNDNLYGQEGDDELNGGEGNDYLYGKDDDDELNGGNGDDLLHGGEDNDTLNGNAGDDILNGENGIDILDGGADDDVLIGGAGADTLTGGTGADVLHGHGLWHKDVNAILAANPGVVFNEQTNSFYFYNTNFQNWNTAQVTASNTLLNGNAGNLANITSQVEYDYLSNIVPAGQGIWTSGQDADTEGAWVYTYGAEYGANFWNGQSAGTAVGEQYTNWAFPYPDNSGGNEDELMFKPGTGFESIDGSINSHFVIEWNAGMMDDDNAIDTLNGGDGNDILYGYGGNDILNGDTNNDIVYGGDGNDTIDGGLGHDTLYGQDGNDTITDFFGTNTIDGGGGDDNITGGSGTDTIYGDGAIDSQSQINTILAANPGVVYSADTNSFYQLITTNANYATASANAAATTLNGVAGHIVTITSAAENTFIDNLIVASTWIAASDSGTEGTWNWIEGAESGTTFWSGTGSGSGGAPVGGEYSNWNGAGEPNDFSSGEDYAEIRTNGVWNDITGTQSRDYVIEWEASNVLGSTGTGDPAGDDIIVGGGGNDTIYGDYLVTGTGSVQGWFYQYYDLATSPSTLATAGFTLNGGRDNTNTVTDSGVTQDTNPAVFDSGDNYALKFTTTLTITTAGTYTFRTASDDGSQLFLDGVQIVNNDGLHGTVTVTSAGQVLTAGTYTLEATFFERTGGNTMDVTMAGPDTGGGYINLENYAGVSVANVGALTDGIDTISGGAGLDTLYGGGGADTFIFEAASAFADTDIIGDFSVLDGDIIDISDIVTGFSGTITDYVQFTVSGSDTLVQVDANGLTGGTSYQTIAELDSVTGLDLASLYANGQIIV